MVSDVYGIRSLPLPTSLHPSLFSPLLQHLPLSSNTFPFIWYQICSDIDHLSSELHHSEATKTPSNQLMGS